MAAGDVTNPIILASGWEMTCDIAGVSTGGTYAFGLGTNNDPATGTPKVTLTVVSLGYDATGAATTVTRTVYGTAQERLRYPNATSNAETGSSPCTIKFALSEYVFAKDNTGGGNSGTAPVVTFLPGVYTQGGTPSNAAGPLTVTNNSTLAYPRVVGAFAGLEFEKIGASWLVEGCFFHWSGKNGKPVACVKYTLTDAHSVTVTATVTAMTVSALADAVPVQVYGTTLTTSGMTQNDIGTLNYQAYPWIGDSASVLDTTDGGATSARPSPLYGPIKVICDPGGTYSRSVAVCDFTSGNDGTGTVGTDPTLVSPYKNIGAAFNAIRTSNNSGTFTSAARNNCGGSIIYLKDNAGGVNAYDWTGATVTAGTVPDCVLTTMPYPGHSRSNCVIGGVISGTKHLGAKVKFQNLKLTLQSAAGVVDPASTTSYYVTDNCEVNCPTAGQPFYYRIGVCDYVRCTFTDFAQNFSPLGAINASYGLVRGNTFNCTNTTLVGKVYKFVGNLKTNTSDTCRYVDYASGAITPTSDNLVWAFNKWTTNNASGTVFAINTTAKTHGCAFVQNLVEVVNNANPVALIGADGSSATVFNNQIIWNNTIVGQRINLAYNENGAGAGATQRLLWSVKNNIFDNDNIKTDTFNGNSLSAMTRTFSAGTVTATCTFNASSSALGHNYQNGDLFYSFGTTPAAYTVQGATISNVTTNTWDYTFAAGSDPGAITVRCGTGPNPLRVADWSQVYSVSWSGNLRTQVVNLGASGSFAPNFAGTKSILPGPITQTISASASCGTNTAAYPAFTSRASWDGVSPGAGGGAYTLQVTSPGYSLQADYLLPYDLAGHVRLATDATGAYANVLTATTTALTSSVNPTTSGNATLLTATVTSSSATGSVSFYDGVTLLGSSSLSAGVGSLSVSSLSVGSHNLTAVYGGDTIYATSTSNTVVQTVNAASTGGVAVVGSNGSPFFLGTDIYMPLP